MIANTFIKRPVTAMVVSIVLVIAGAICILTLPIDQYPDITPPVVQVNGQFTGADAQTVEQTVATPIEDRSMVLREWSTCKATIPTTV